MPNPSRPSVLVQLLRGLGYSVLVVGLGAAILWPFVRLPAREKARQSACAANLKQISLAAIQYAQDYDGRFPIKPRPGGDWVARSWAARPMHGSRYHLYAPSGGPVWDYAKNTCINRCPSDPDNRSRGYAAGAHSSYLWNDALCGKLIDDCTGQPLVWDREPWHSHQRNVAFTNGQVRLLPAPTSH